MPVRFAIRLRKNHRAAAASPKGDEGLFLKGNGSGTLLLIHGLTGTPNEMRFLANFFNKKGFSVSCPRLANHGEPVEILKTTKWQDCYQSVRTAFREILSRSGGPVFVSGLSMGALLALLLAQEFPDETAGVSCLSPTLFYDGWNMPWSKHLLPLAYFTPLKHFFYFKEEPPYGIKNESIRQRVDKYYRSATLDDIEGVAQFGYPYFPVTLLCELRLLVRHLTQRLPSVRVPLQLIQAHEDDMTSVKNSRFIYDRVASKIKEIELLYHSYHVITADQERDVVAAKMQDFFDRMKARFEAGRTSERIADAIAE